MIDPPERRRFERARETVASAAFARGAVIDRRVLPQGTHFVDDRNAQPAARSDGRKSVEHRRMGVQHVGLESFRELDQPAARRGHLGQIGDARKPGYDAGAHHRAVKRPAVHLVDCTVARRMTRRRELERFPAERALLPQDCSRAKCIAAVQRERMVEEVQHPHRRTRGPSPWQRRGARPAACAHRVRASARARGRDTGPRSCAPCARG